MGCEKQLTVDQESLRNHTMAKIAGQSNRTLPVVWLGRVNRYPYPRIKCMKYRNLNQVTRAEIYLFKKESLVEKINAASWVTVLDLWKREKSSEKKDKKKESGRENGRKEKGEETRGEDRRDGERKGLSPGLE
ncbi:hypothetical protein TNCV_4802261 [Trichonephila clavipes]|nr:hypothetical protein TNCV_4802261 [Trichonephila clavipes]